MSSFQIQSYYKRHSNSTSYLIIARYFRYWQMKIKHWFLLYSPERTINWIIHELEQSANGAGTVTRDGLEASY